MTKAQVVEAIDAAEEYQLEPPRPLVRQTEPAEPFPVDALGDIMGNAARGIQDRTQAPMAICAQSILGAGTLAVQGHANVELPTGQARPISSFFLSVAATGERKSACDKEALWPIKKRESALREVFAIDQETWRNDFEAWETQRRQILGDKKKFPNQANKKAALDDLGPAPIQPLTPMLTATEPTFEGLAKLYTVGHPSLGVFSAEGGQFIGGHGMSPENKLRTATALSTLWDGETINRVRAGDGAVTLLGRRLSMHLMVQPEVASMMLTDRLLADQGLLSRVLVTAPAPTSGTRLWRDPKPESMDAIKRYSARLLDIMETPLPLAEGKRNELEPRRLPLSPEARKGWIAFTDHIEGLMASGGYMEPIRGLANKLAEHAARLAAVIALVDDLATPNISAAHIDAGIQLTEHYAAEALRLFASGRTDPNLILAQKTLDWLHLKWGESFISSVELYQSGPNPIRDAKTAKMVIGILEEHGWLVPVDGGCEINGERRRKAWRVVK